MGWGPGLRRQSLPAARVPRQAASHRGPPGRLANMAAENPEKGKNPQDRTGREDQPTGDGEPCPVSDLGAGRAEGSAPSCVVGGGWTGSCPSGQAPACPCCY